jgi:hypothetical protein
VCSQIHYLYRSTARLFMPDQPELIRRVDAMARGTGMVGTMTTGEEVAVVFLLMTQDAGRRKTLISRASRRNLLEDRSCSPPPDRSCSPPPDAPPDALPPDEPLPPDAPPGALPYAPLLDAQVPPDALADAPPLPDLSLKAPLPPGRSCSLPLPDADLETA